MGSDKARSVQARFLIAPVENRTCGLTASGSAPLIDLHGVTMKRRFPFRQFHRYPPVYSLRVHWVPLFPSSQRLGAFAISPSPGVPSFPGFRLLCPFRLSVRALAFRWGLPYLLPTRLHIPHEVSRVPHGKTQTERCRWRVSLLAPSALCGSPVFAQRVGQVDLCDEGNTSQTGLPSSVLSPLVYDFRLD